MNEWGKEGGRAWKTLLTSYEKKKEKPAAHSLSPIGGEEKERVFDGREGKGRRGDVLYPESTTASW